MTMLKRMPLFRELTYKQINVISAMLKAKVVPAGTVIVREGEPGDAFYIVKSGEVVVTAKSETGKETVANLSEAEYFGEIALITDQPRIATVTSISETDLLILEKSDFNAVVEFVGEHGSVPLQLEQAGSRRLLDTKRKLKHVSGAEESKTDDSTLGK